MIRFLIFTLCFWLIAGFSHARESLPLDTGRTDISLVSDYDTLAPGQSFTVALRMRFEGNWYTYWRNAGDSGEPVNLAWDLPAGVTAGPIQWPAPKIKTVGPIVSYAMAGEVWLPVDITIDETIDPNVPITLKAHAYFLVCDDICVPEDGALSLPIGIGSSEKNAGHAAQIEAAKAKIPQRGSARGSAILDNGQIIFNVADLPSGFDAPTLFPNENPIIVHSEPITLTAADGGVRFVATSGYGWDDGTPDAFEATLVSADGQSVLVPVSTASVVDIGAVKTGGDRIGSGLWGAAIGAFIGGLILNLMPCVFPIISLKALSLATTAHGERSEVRRSAWAYTAGVLVSFLIFAGLLVVLKGLGAQVGWGFQLQSPWVVALLSILLFAIGLNLLGAFEVSGRFQNIGSDRVNRAGPFGSFWTGVLAVIVATPCAAPFMAGAVGVALAGSVFVTLIVFLALGLGFALPFLLVAYIPRLLARLPKPGPWMDTFKQFLAFPMFAAAIFFANVLSQQSGSPGMLKLLSAILALCFTIWILRKSGVFAKLIGAAMLVVTLFLPLTVSYRGDSSVVSESSDWSPQAVSTARAEGRPVFVDFTAAWCVTCKVNEITVLKTKKTTQLFDQTDTAFLVADWTNKNDVIAAELKKHGRAGVPLYLVYKPGAAEPIILPQVLTYEIVREALE